MEMKTIKIPESEYDRLVEARRKLVLGGINKLKPEVQERIKDKIEAFDKFTLGMVVGICAENLIEVFER